MNEKDPNPPKLAIWLLRNACPGDNEALTGDLIERFGEGQTRGWIWRQVLIALAVGVLREIQRHWPAVCYAIAGTVMQPLLWSTVKNLPLLLLWWVLPWPWSQIVFELSPHALLALAALPVLAIGLIVRAEFRWISLFRTGLINFALTSLDHYKIDVFPWLLRPVPGDPYHRVLIFPAEIQILLFFSTFLIAAWLGCVSPRPPRYRDAQRA